METQAHGRGLQVVDGPAMAGGPATAVDRCRGWTEARKELGVSRLGFLVSWGGYAGVLH